MNILDLINNNDFRKWAELSVEKYGYQKLESQFQSILFSLLLKSESLPLVEGKRGDIRHDIISEGDLIELKFHYECDLSSIIKYYEGSNKNKDALAIEADIANSHYAIIFILNRKEDFKKKHALVVEERYKTFIKQQRSFDVEFSELFNLLAKKHKKFHVTNGVIYEKKDWDLKYIAIEHNSSK